jgi:hypothetical protein
LKTTASPTFNIVNLSTDPTSDNSAIRKSYYDTLQRLVIWQQSVISIFDPSIGLPPLPSVGDRYICDVTAGGWTQNHIYQWNSSLWVNTSPIVGMMTYVKTGTSHAERYVHYDTINGWTEVSDVIDHTLLLNRGNYTHPVIDNHMDNVTTAHFGQDLRTTGTPTFSYIYISDPILANQGATKNYVDNAVISMGGAR